LLVSIDNSINRKSLHNLQDNNQTDNLAYQELENISATLNHNPDNTISVVLALVGNIFSQYKK
jgi:hypothetical protein